MELKVAVGDGHEGHLRRLLVDAHEPRHKRGDLEDGPVEEGNRDVRTTELKLLPVAVEGAAVWKVKRLPDFLVNEADRKQQNQGD